MLNLFQHLFERDSKTSSERLYTKKKIKITTKQVKFIYYQAKPETKLIYNYIKTTLLFCVIVLAWLKRGELFTTQNRMKQKKLYKMMKFYQH